jgi:hypothetical protein
MDAVLCRLVLELEIIVSRAEISVQHIPYANYVRPVPARGDNPLSRRSETKTDQPATK